MKYIQPKQRFKIWEILYIGINMECLLYEGNQDEGWHGQRNIQQKTSPWTNKVNIELSKKLMRCYTRIWNIFYTFHLLAKI